MTLQTAIDVLKKERAPAYRARQLTHAVYSELAGSWDEVTALPNALRERLERDAPLRTLTEQASQRAEDGTIKLQLRTHDGYPLEAVAMRHGDRRTVCLSSQSGCALACTFCATGRMGLGRNLTPEEIS
jgi:23S rRNA (adenine2503-C2)-methyltransferase